MRTRAEGDTVGGPRGGKPTSRAAHPLRSSRPVTSTGFSRASPSTTARGESRANTAAPNKRIVSRTYRKKVRPPTRDSIAEEGPGEGGGGVGGVESESESDMTSGRVTADIDFGGVDISSNDGGWDTDLELEEIQDSYDATGKSVYLEMCRKLDVIPASYFLRHMKDTSLEMKHHGLGPTGVKPIAVSLVSNTYVTKINLEDNWLGEVGGIHVCDMLQENCYITDLDLSDNKLGASFAEKLVDVLVQNNTLTHITLSGNELDDRAAVYLAEAMLSTNQLIHLDLSHNHLGELAGVALGPAISENTSIKHLDLSWNSIRRKGAVAIANGIKQNVLMSHINLSWNGFGKDGAKALGDALKLNACLEEMDISNNRITTEGSVLMAKGLVTNESLHVLKLGQNPMQTAGCYAVLAAVKKNPGCVLHRLDFSDIMVNTDFFAILDDVKELLPNLQVRTGGDGVPMKPKARVHPMIKLQNYIAKHNLRLVDFFMEFDKDGSMCVSREEFAQGIESMGIKLTTDEIGELVNEFDKDGDGEINYSEFVLGHQEYSDKERKMANAIGSMKKTETKNLKS